MRGLDYRSKSNTLYLVIAQQFSCVREALQGVARVGRFGDPCHKVKFADCGELVNQQTQAEHNRRLLAYIEEVKAKPQVKAVQVGHSPKKPQPGQGSNMTQKRIRALVSGQTSLFDFTRAKP